MPRFSSEESRLKYYTDKWGEEEGLARYERAAGAPPSPDSPLDAEQPSLRFAGTAEKTPKRRSKKPAKKDVVESLAAGIALGDTGLAWFYPPWREDRLQHEEIGRLADALADEILYSERLTQWIVQAQKSSVHIKLAMVCASIALPRMARHGMLPAGMFGAPPSEVGEQYQVSEDGVVGTPADFYAAVETSG